MPAPRSRVLLREMAEIALRRAGVTADPDEALLIWWRYVNLETATVPTGTPKELVDAAYAIEREMGEALAR